MRTRRQTLREVVLAPTRLALAAAVLIAAAVLYIVFQDQVTAWTVPVGAVLGVVLGMVHVYLVDRVRSEARRDYVQQASLLARIRDTRDSAIRTAEQWERLYRGADERAERLADELVAARQGATA